MRILVPLPLPTHPPPAQAPSPGVGEVRIGSDGGGEMRLSTLGALLPLPRQAMTEPSHRWSK